MLAWTGQASEVTLQKSGEKEISKKLQPNQNQIELNLPLGNYAARLRGDEGVSFVWTRNLSAKSYQLKLYKEGLEVRNVPSVQNSSAVNFSADADLEWTVEGVDEDGFIMPSNFKNKIFIREQPLQAPQLKQVFSL